jgi:hypothetical protein
MIGAWRGQRLLRLSFGCRGGRGAVGPGRFCCLRPWRAASCCFFARSLLLRRVGAAAAAAAGSRRLPLGGGGGFGAGQPRPHELLGALWQTLASYDMHSRGLLSQLSNTHARA